MTPLSLWRSSKKMAERHRFFQSEPDRSLRRVGKSELGKGRAALEACRVGGSEPGKDRAAPKTCRAREGEPDRDRAMSEGRSGKGCAALKAAQPRRLRLSSTRHDAQSPVKMPKRQFRCPIDEGGVGGREGMFALSPAFCIRDGFTKTVKQRC